MENIFLCGFMGCGKTTLGKRLSHKLGCSFIDMDDYITEKEQLSIPQIFEQKGEEYFRSLETAVIREICESSGGGYRVVATGGGALLREENAAIAQKNGRVVFLDTPFSLCYLRISGDKNRPLAASLTRDELHALYSKRRSIYKRNAQITVCTPYKNNTSIEKLLIEILQNLD